MIREAVAQSTILASLIIEYFKVRPIITQKDLSP
jgi:hypothetical protein